MAIFFEKKDRHVIPNWRNFENTAQLGELNSSRSTEFYSSFKPNIDDLLEDWEYAKNLGVAGDILSAALVCNQLDNPTVQEISSFVLKNKETSTPALIKTASNIKENGNGNENSKFEISSIDDFLYRGNLNILFNKINFYKQKLILNPRNAIAWVEISRLYAINGQDKKAEWAIKNALYLAPENRFVLRNMARFFAHIGDFEFAHDHIRKSELINHDPWLIATEISLADLRGRGSRFVKKGIQIIDSDNFHPFNISELSSSIATLEMKSSKTKTSRRLFEKSLILPNDNSLAQAEWASQEDPSLICLTPAQFKVKNSYEAFARNKADHKKWTEAIEYSKRWFLDLPFSKTAIVFGSNIASCKLKDHKQAVSVAKLGLISHPRDPQLLNNIAYSLCLNNELAEAEATLNQVRKEDFEFGDITSICLTATKGLLNFRKGLYDKGRDLYLKAMEQTHSSKNDYYNSLALLNYVREELLLGEIDMTPLFSKVEEIKKFFAGKDICDLADEVLQMKKENSTNTQQRV